MILYTIPTFCSNFNKQLYYEIHITVKTDSIQDFRYWCSLNNIKPVFIDFQLSNKITVNEVMTSTTVYSNDRDIWVVVNNLLKLLHHSYDILRVKVETEPSHYLAPQTHQDIFIDPQHYFESHIAVKTTKRLLPQILKKCSTNEIYMSRNPFKEIKNSDSIIQMCTIRSRNCYHEFITKVNDTVCLLQSFGEVKEPIVEFAMFDTNVSHDLQWINQYKTL